MNLFPWGMLVDDHHPPWEWEWSGSFAHSAFDPGSGRVFWVYNFDCAWLITPSGVESRI